MNDKEQILTACWEEFNRWEELLAGLSEEQITARQLPANLSIKDVIGHLHIWQQRSIARLEAGLDHTEPEFPGWPADLDPESEDDLDDVNAWIHVIYRDQPWSRVYQDWREGFLRFLELGEAIPGEELLEAGKYSWLFGYPLIAVLEGSYNHHHEEHLEPLRAWLRQHGHLKNAG